MSDRFDSYWKTVIAEVEADPGRTKACVEQAAQACGFRRHGEEGESQGVDSWQRTGWFLWLPMIQEWCIAVNEAASTTEFSIRFGMRFGWLYYVMFIGGSVAAITLAPQIGTYPALTGPLIALLALLFATPLIHALTARFQATLLERRLWKAVATLGPWRSSRVIIRTLNRAYGTDLVIENRDLAAPFRTPATARKS